MIRFLLSLSLFLGCQSIAFAQAVQSWTRVDTNMQSARARALGSVFGFTMNRMMSDSYDDFPNEVLDSTWAHCGASGGVRVETAIANSGAASSAVCITPTGASTFVPQITTMSNSLGGVGNIPGTMAYAQAAGGGIARAQATFLLDGPHQGLLVSNLRILVGGVDTVGGAAMNANLDFGDTASAFNSHGPDHYVFAMGNGGSFMTIEKKFDGTMVFGSASGLFASSMPRVDPVVDLTASGSIDAGVWGVWQNYGYYAGGSAVYWVE